MEKAEEAGKVTVRLHTGDPSIYGAIREQMDRLDKKKIAYDVCPVSYTHLPIRSQTDWSSREQRS